MLIRSTALDDKPYNQVIDKGLARQMAYLEVPYRRLARSLYLYAGIISGNKALELNGEALTSSTRNAEIAIQNGPSSATLDPTVFIEHADKIISSGIRRAESIQISAEQ